MNLHVMKLYMFYETTGFFPKKVPSDLHQRKGMVKHHNPNFIPQEDDPWSISPGRKRNSLIASGKAK